MSGLHHFFLPIFTVLGPCIMSMNNEVIGWTPRAKAGDEVELEVDLQSVRKEKRLLRFIINGVIQKTVIRGLPDCVKFGVCLNSFCVPLPSLSLSLFPLVSLHYHSSPSKNQDVRMIGERKIDGERRKEWSRDVVAEVVSAETSKVIRSDTSLNINKLKFSDPLKFRIERNSIIHKGIKCLESCIFVDEYKTVCCSAAVVPSIIITSSSIHPGCS